MSVLPATLSSRSPENRRQRIVSVIVTRAIVAPMIERGGERDEAKNAVWSKISKHLHNAPIPQSVHGSYIFSKVNNFREKESFAF